MVRRATWHGRAGSDRVHHPRGLDPLWHRLGIWDKRAFIVGRTIGDGDDRLVKDNTTQSILLALLVAFLFTGIGYATADQVFGLLGPPDSLIPLIRDYMDIWFLGPSQSSSPRSETPQFERQAMPRRPGAS